MFWNRHRDDELIHLRMENTRLLGIIETLASKPPTPPARVTPVRVGTDMEPAKGGVMTRTQALAILQKALDTKNKKVEEAKVS